MHPVHLIVVSGAPAQEVSPPTLTLIPYPNRLFLLLIDAAAEEPETAKMARGVGDADEGEFDHSQNDELRMCGLARDEEEDDVREDCAELFGRSAADPLPCDQDAVPVHGEGADPDADGGDSEVAGSNRPSTSLSGMILRSTSRKVPGKARPVRYAATCKLCKK